MVVVVTSKVFRSTPPREGRLGSPTALSSEEDVSIHAPTRGATAFADQTDLPFMVSIHAPTRGATRLCNEVVIPAMVSIHAPTRGATEHRHQIVQVLIVSIHAPTRGATFPPRHSNRRRICFDPRPHARGDFRWSFGDAVAPNVSIHAPTRGATGDRCGARRLRNRFDPRPHARGDPIPVTGA